MSEQEKVASIKISSNCCSYCAITLCRTCLENKNKCHLTESNKPVCIEHSKTNKLVSVEGNRICVAHQPIGESDPRIKKYCQDVFKKNPYNLFKSFYNDLNKTCRYFEIFDAIDDNNW